MEKLNYTTETKTKTASSPMKKIMAFLSAHSTMVSILGFCITAIAVLLTAVLALQEYVVSVCVLIVLETAMAALLHKVELWKHGALLGAQFLVAATVHRIPLIALCAIVYVAAIIALQFIRSKNES